MTALTLKGRKTILGITSATHRLDYAEAYADRMASTGADIINIAYDSRNNSWVVWMRVTDAERKAAYDLDEAWSINGGRP